jgi:hypothetical protein
MTDNTTIALDPVQFLKQVVALWPTGTSRSETMLDKLRPYLAESFEVVDLLNSVGSIVGIRECEITSQGEASIYFYDRTECRQRAMLERAESSGWKLKSLKFECPICFGIGENDGAICTMCGGSGWGAS